MEVEGPAGPAGSHVQAQGGNRLFLSRAPPPPGELKGRILPGHLLCAKNTGSSLFGASSILHLAVWVSMLKAKHLLAQPMVVTMPYSRLHL